MKEGNGDGDDDDDDGGGCRGDGTAWDLRGLETSSSGRSCYDTVAASGIWRMAAGTAVGVETLCGERDRKRERRSRNY